MKQKKTIKEVTVFKSFQEENNAEIERLKNMSLEERLKEFSVLQERRWGKNWRSTPIVKKAAHEKLF